MSEKADLADKVVARVRDWCSLLFIQDQSIEGIILSTVSEQALLTLKTDVDEVFRELRGAASISCPRCRGIVLELEKIMKLLRTHKCVAHLSLFLSIAIPTPPSSNTAAIAPILPAKKRRGTTKGDLKWRVGDLMSARIGGLKISNKSLRSKQTSLTSKLKSHHQLTSLRLSQEEIQIKTNNANGRKNLRFTKEEAKTDSLCHTKMCKISDIEIQGK